MKRRYPASPIWSKSTAAYAGVVGWFNHLNEGEMVVGIRSALIEGKQAYLYAGAGIVEGSDPDREMRETEMKLRALLDVFSSS